MQPSARNDVAVHERLFQEAEQKKLEKEAEVRYAVRSLQLQNNKTILLQTLIDLWSRLFIYLEGFYVFILKCMGLLTAFMHRFD